MRRPPRRRATTAAAVALACLATGCRGGEDDEGPPPRSRTPEQAERCLRADGFDVRGGRVNTRTDRDAPDHALFLAAGDAGVEIAFYESRARAERLRPQVGEAVDRADAEVDHSDRASIVWFRKPDDEMRERVWRCVFAG